LIHRNVSRDFLITLSPRVGRHLELAQSDALSGVSGDIRLSPFQNSTGSASLARAAML
jgi:hypothetical protein